MQRRNGLYILRRGRALLRHGGPPYDARRLGGRGGILFSRKMGYRKLGLAFCAALSGEAAKLSQILENYFEIATVNCKVCGVPKAEMGAMESDKVGSISCNPIEQAEVLNAAKTDLNLLLGLCVGHDALFIKYSQAPVVPVAAKDRVIAHNPLGALYCSAIFKRMMKEAKNQQE